MGILKTDIRCTQAWWGSHVRTQQESDPLQAKDRRETKPADALILDCWPRGL